MKPILANVKVPALISLITIFPFILLEIIYRNPLPGEFPYVLFAALFLVMLFFILILRPVLKNVHSGALNTTTLNLVTRTVLLLLLGYFWISIVIDQLPCFLGVSNCD